jgi:two-component system chemotaxis response regulator CheY
MSILLVDDSATIRTLVKRALADLQYTDVVEAANGLEALVQITRRRFDLVILDMEMPLMDGLEALESVRAVPAYSSLPVVMHTSERNEALVRRLVELGIDDYVSKPLSHEQLTTRLSRILARLQESSAARPVSAALPRGEHVLVVEQDPDRRHYMVNVLTGPFHPTPVDCGAAALQLLLAPSPPTVDVVLVGQDVGLPPVELFLKKLRGVPSMAAAHVVGCVPRGEPPDERMRRWLDGTLEWRMVPEVFLAEFQRAISRSQTALTRLLHARPSLTRDVVSATEQVFGMMASCEIEQSPPDSARQHKWPGHGVHALITLTAHGETLLGLLFRASVESARVITARMVGSEPGEVVEADILASVAEIGNIVLGRVRNRLVEAGIAAEMGLPATWIGETGDAAPVDDPGMITVPFESPSADVWFECLLTAGTTPAHR